MADSPVTKTVSAGIVRTQLDSLLEEVGRKKTRFLITKGGKPAAVLLSVTDLDDILEELDPEFQKSLKVADREYRSSRAVALRDYIKRQGA